MPRNPIASVEIVEPPIGELTKTRSSFKRACLTSCLFMVVFFAMLVGGVRLLIGSGPKTIKREPPNFPTTIPVYDRDAIERITYIPAKYKYRSTEIAAVFPRIILSPLLIRTQNTELSSAPRAPGNGLSIETLWNIIDIPADELKDTVQIEWGKLEAEPSFVYTYYRKELTKKQFTIENEVRLRARQHFEFHNNMGITGFLVVEGDEETYPGSDRAVLTVNIPISSSTAK